MNDLQSLAFLTSRSYFLSPLKRSHSKDYIVIYFTKWYEPGRSYSSVREGKTKLRDLNLGSNIFKSNGQASYYKNTMIP